MPKKKTSDIKNGSSLMAVYSYYDYDRDSVIADKSKSVSVCRTFVASDEKSYDLQVNHMQDKFAYVSECEKYKRRPMIKFDEDTFDITNATDIENELSSRRFDTPMYPQTLKPNVDEDEIGGI